MTRWTARLALAGALATTTLGLAACTDDAEGDSASPSAPSTEQVQATRLADVPEGTAMAPGLYAMDFVTDQADTPMVVIDVPAGYLGGGGGSKFLADGEVAFRHFDAWTVAEVATAPCGDTEWVDPGPGVDDLTDALSALPVWESTTPVPQTLDGHDGVYMELSVPATVPAECGGQPRSWRDVQGGYQGVGEGKTQRLWIADVDGQRLMLVAGYFPGPEGPTPAQVDEITRMAEGARFVDAAQVAP